MPADNRVQIIIETIDQASANLAKIRQEMANMGQGGSAATSALGGGFLKMAGSMAAAIGIITTIDAAARAMFAAMKQGVEDVRAQEEAEIRLVSAMRNRGKASLEALNHARALANEYENLTGTGDELILGAQATLVAFGNLSGQGLDRATKAALDLAAQGRDLNSVVDAIAKAANGNYMALQRMGIKTDESKAQAERFEEALSKIETVAGGTAQAVGQGMSGSFTRFASSVGNLVEAIARLGLTITKVGSILNWFAGKINFVADFLDAMSAALGDEGVADMMAQAGQATEDTGEQMDRFAEIAKELGVQTLPEMLSKGQQLIEMFAYLTRQQKEGEISAKQYAGQIKQLGSQAKSLSDAGVPGLEALVEEFKHLEQAAKDAEEGLQATLDVLLEGVAVPPLLEDQVKAAVSGIKTLRDFRNATSDVYLGMEMMRRAFREGQIDAESLEFNLMQLALQLKPLHGDEIKEVKDNIDKINTAWKGGKLTTDEYTTAISALQAKLDELRSSDPFSVAVEAGEDATSAWAGFGDELGQIAGSQVATLGGSLVSAAFEGKKSFGEFFKSFALQMSQAIVQALILKAIMVAIGGNSGGQVLASSYSVPGAAKGGQLMGPRVGRDNTLAILAPGEVIVRTPVVEAIENQLLRGTGANFGVAPNTGVQVQQQATQQQQAPVQGSGLTLNAYIRQAVTRDDAERIAEVLNVLIKDYGLELYASKVIE